MQSIIRSSIKNKNLFLNNRGQFLITRSFCNDHSGNNHDHSANHKTSFEKFKENRDLIKKKSELIKEITKSRLLGETDKIYKLQEQVSSIEKVLDPTIEQFSVQSKQQKEAELEIWKRFLEKKGITTRSQLSSVNKFEFERFKTTGLLDAESEKQRKDKEIEKAQLSTDKYTGYPVANSDKFTPKERVEADPVLRDAFPSPFILSQRVVSNEFKEREDEKEQQKIDDSIYTDVVPIIKTKKDRMDEFVQKMQDQSNKDPQFKRLVMDFLDDGIPLKDKLIFRDDFDVSEEVYKNLNINNDHNDYVKEILDSNEPITEEDQKLIESTQQKILDLEVREIFKDYKINSSLEEKRLNIIFRNNKILRHKIQEMDATNHDGSINMEKLLSEPLAIENLTLYRADSDPSSFSGSYLYNFKNGGNTPKKIEDLHKIPYQVAFKEDIKNPRELEKLTKATEVLSGFSDEHGSLNDVKLFMNSVSPSEIEALNEMVKMCGGGAISNVVNGVTTFEEMLESIESSELMKPPGDFEEEAILAPDEVPEFGYDKSVIYDFKDRTPVLTEDTPVDRAYKDRVVQEGRLRDIETKMRHITDVPELDSPQLMKDLKVKLYEDEKQLERDLLETNDPMMIRNFIKYKYDEQKEKLDKKKEADFKRHTSTLIEVQQEITQRSLTKTEVPLYSPTTGKLFTPKKKNPKCLLCQNPNWQVDPINSPFLTLYLNDEGDILPRHYSGNCLKHQKKIARTIRQAKALGIFSYKKGTFTIHDPNVYSLTKSELEEYEKWYNGSYTQEELEQVYEQFEAERTKEEEEEELERELERSYSQIPQLDAEDGKKQGQQEQILLEFGIENNDLGRMYGKDQRQ
ncbi:hypothetical protein RB653_006934 [Dictyostelium firmibasis]|uniref:Ribosomal protein S18 n=1 Tax=Dictyostelium firmibasis TaxID=79012 RepID=A0AAN7TVL4_9MYCE